MILSCYQELKTLNILYKCVKIFVFLTLRVVIFSLFDMVILEYPLDYEFDSPAQTTTSADAYRPIVKNFGPKTTLWRLVFEKTSDH